MQEHTRLAEHFETQRTHLRGVAYRILGSLSEADDAVQETWLRLSRTDTSDVTNLDGWLTTVVGRICLDMLRARATRREEPLGANLLTPTSREDGSDPEQEALLAESIGLALLVVLDSLTPVERLTFVLHDIFAVPFVTIAPIVGRSEAMARQLASRARRRVRGSATIPAADIARQHSVVEAFLAASRDGDFDALIALLAPDVTLHADRTAMPAHDSREVRGAHAVAQQFAGRARAARAALVNGAIGVVIAPHGKLRLVLCPTIVDGRIVRIDVIADPLRLRQLDLAVLDL